MTNVNVNMNPSMLTLFLAAAQRLYDRDKTAILFVAALMERMAQEEDLTAALEQLEGFSFGTNDESDEIEDLGRSLGLED